MYNNKLIFVTGGTGSFGHTIVSMTLAKCNPHRLVIYLCDEMKLWEMVKLYAKDMLVQFFIDEVRKKYRLSRDHNMIGKI